MKPAKPERIEFRPNDDGSFDELVIDGASFVHFELMDDDCVFVSIIVGEREVRGFIGAEKRLLRRARLTFNLEEQAK